MKLQITKPQPDTPVSRRARHDHRWRHMPLEEPDGYTNVDVSGEIDIATPETTVLRYIVTFRRFQIRQNGLRGLHPGGIASGQVRAALMRWRIHGFAPAGLAVRRHFQIHVECRPRNVP